MLEPAILIGAIFTLAMLYVLLPVIGETYARFRRPRAVRCPDCGKFAEVRLDAEHAARTAAFGRPSARIEDCSFWPEREGCDQACVPDVPGTEEAEPVPRVTAVR